LEIGWVGAGFLVLSAVNFTPMNRFFSLLAVPALLSATLCRAQDDGFKDALTTIMRDAPNQFRNIKGRQVSDNMYNIVWDCGVKIPGMVAARFVYSKGTFYEGALLQTDDTTAVRTAYNHYIQVLDGCLKPQGYTALATENLKPGAEPWDKVAFLPHLAPETPLEKCPSHVALEVTYSKERQNYTLELYIYEH
jgi:hypothetical protein